MLILSVLTSGSNGEHSHNFLRRKTRSDKVVMLPEELLCSMVIAYVIFQSLRFSIVQTQLRFI